MSQLQINIDICRSIRANVEFDSARLIKFSPDNRSFITCLENGNCIRVFKFKKNEDGSFSKIEQVIDDFPKVSVGFTPSPGFLLELFK